MCWNTCLYNVALIPQLQKVLLKWYAFNARVLPWRKNKDPYRIWVSEMMLVQTQVNTAIDYFNRFIKKFPTLKALAQSDLDLVLKHWQGLGYYRRARHMHETSRHLVKFHAAKFPQTPQELIKLKGIGPYMANALASIAFDYPAVVLDGNVKRILSRINMSNDHLAKFANQLECKENPGDFNQALMDLGATICKPKNPNCKLCPIQLFCKAYQMNAVLNYPKAKPKTKSKTIYQYIFVLQKHDQYAFQKRSALGRWPNLWEMINFESPRKLKTDEIQNKLETKIINEKIKPVALGHFKHQLTHQTIHAIVMHAKSQSNAKLKIGQWQSKNWLSIKPFSKLQTKAAALFFQHTI